MDRASEGSEGESGGERRGSASDGARRAGQERIILSWPTRLSSDLFTPDQWGA
ncbi:hypothetical protein BDZ89DRAFT_1073083 [Hymenopellis radicata]|nr:hypothetical protein BDZ89DRAFT_1073083 [Hymenopellis radicata]